MIWARINPYYKGILGNNMLHHARRCAITSNLIYYDINDNNILELPNSKLSFYEHRQILTTMDFDCNNRHYHIEDMRHKGAATFTYNPLWEIPSYETHICRNICIEIRICGLLMHKWQSDQGAIRFSPSSEHSYFMELFMEKYMPCYFIPPQFKFYQEDYGIRCYLQDIDTSLSISVARKYQKRALEIVNQNYQEFFLSIVRKDRKL